VTASLFPSDFSPLFCCHRSCTSVIDGLDPGGFGEAVSIHLRTAVRPNVGSLPRSHFWPKLFLELLSSKVDSFKAHLFPPWSSLTLSWQQSCPKLLSASGLLAFSFADSGLILREAALCTSSLNTFQLALMIDCHTCLWFVCTVIVSPTCGHHGGRHWLCHGTSDSCKCVPVPSRSQASSVRQQAKDQQKERGCPPA